MAVFKCKMCGGTLEISNESVAICEYCGTKQTLPKLGDEERANLYDRANHFRRNNDFDKAMSIYEKILNEDKTDAEAYWSIVLCRYGIEYVEDPSTHKRLPTVNRAQFTSIFDDEDYKSALQYADGYQKDIYEEEAKSINEIQKGILAISQNEDPFDVFICYKETDNNGRRTQDSVLANDLYHQLTQEGFKVFFSRITLEDKLGTAYEPYIFAALNSAKVMVVLGTRPEHFNAVWVKNEWSRFLSLIKTGKNKILIPAYRDMDPYDLPEEFSHLQSQDMSKLGFMQDLIRGIKKLTEKDKPEIVKTQQIVVQNSGINVDNLLRRAELFLEDRDWDNAFDYSNRILDNDATNAKAYIIQLLCELKLNKEEKLASIDQPLTNYKQFNRALEYADDNRKDTLNKYNLAATENYCLKINKAIDDVKSLDELEELLNIPNGLIDCDAKQLLLKRVEAIKQVLDRNKKENEIRFKEITEKLLFHKKGLVEYRKSEVDTNKKQEPYIKGCAVWFVFVIILAIGGFVLSADVPFFVILGIIAVVIGIIILASTPKNETDHNCEDEFTEKMDEEISKLSRADKLRLCLSDTQGMIVKLDDIYAYGGLWEFWQVISQDEETVRLLSMSNYVLCAPGCTKYDGDGKEYFIPYIDSALNLEIKELEAEMKSVFSVIDSANILTENEYCQLIREGSDICFIPEDFWLCPNDTDAAEKIPCVVNGEIKYSKEGEKGICPVITLNRKKLEKALLEEEFKECKKLLGIKDSTYAEKQVCNKFKKSTVMKVTFESNEAGKVDKVFNVCSEQEVLDALKILESSSCEEPFLIMESDDGAFIQTAYDKKTGLYCSSMGDGIGNSYDIVMEDGSYELNKEFVENLFVTFYLEGLIVSD